MRVLIVFRDEISDNLFVSTLCKGIKEEGINISHSLNRFWNDDSFFDIIHFQWPEELAGWTIQDVNIIEKLKKRLAFFKYRGTKIVYTRHNLHPHYNSPVLSDVYDIIERSADLIVHMGEFSKNQYESENPHSDNVVIPHHIYENTYNESLSKKEARKKLGIPDDKFVITAFGKFRNKEEIDMTVSAFRKLKIKNKYLLAPRLFPFSKKPLKDSLLKRLASKVGYYLIIPFFRLYNIYGGSNEHIIPDEELSFYIAASDVIFIQRKKILNSGNITLGFLFGKIVTGPDTGNVGEILRLTENPVFDPDDIKSVVNALNETYILAKSNHGKTNYDFSMRNYNIRHISRLYIKEYNRLINNSDRS